MEQSKYERRRWIVLIILCVSLIILAVDATVLNMALPSISRDLGSSASELQWIVDSYILVFAALLLTMGAIGDRFGRKRLMQAGLLVFGLGSLGAALSTSTVMLIFFRAFLGIGGAMMIPSTLSIIVDTFRDPKERAQAIATWAAVFALGAGLGPVVGGYLLEYFHWSAVFYINLPIVAIGITGGFVFIRESRGEEAPRPDIAGVILSTGGLFALVYGIIEAGNEGWTSSEALMPLGIGIVILAVFALWEKNSKSPMLPLNFFRNMSFTGATVAMILIAFAMMGSLFFMSQYFQSAQGYSPVAAALRMLPMSAVVFTTAMFSARIALRIGNKLTVSLGIFIAGCGLFYLSRAAEVDTSYPVLLGGIAIMAAGMGLTMSPATTSMMNSLPLSRAGIGSAMNTTTRQLGGALGIAVLGSLMNAIYLTKIDDLEVIASLPGEAVEAVRSSIQGAHIIAGNFPTDVAQAIVDGSSRAFTVGMTDAMLVGSIIMAITAVITAIILPHRVTPYAEVEVVDMFQEDDPLSGAAERVAVMSETE